MIVDINTQHIEQTKTKEHTPNNIYHQQIVDQKPNFIQKKSPKMDEDFYD